MFGNPAFIRIRGLWNKERGHRHKIKDTTASRTGNEVHGFYPFYVQTFYVEHNCKILECFSFCLFICQSRLLQFRECYRRLALIFAGLESQPVLLYIDYTMVPKFKEKIRGCIRSVRPCLDGHCFVSIMLRILVWSGNRMFWIYF